jgi:hypothetical protein
MKLKLKTKKFKFKFSIGAKALTALVILLKTLTVFFYKRLTNESLFMYNLQL